MVDYSEDGFSVDDHDLVVSYGVGSIYHCYDAGMGQKISGRIFLPSLTLIQDDFDLTNESIIV